MCQPQALGCRSGSSFLAKRLAAVGAGAQGLQLGSRLSLVDQLQALARPSYRPVAQRNPFLLRPACLGLLALARARPRPAYDTESGELFTAPRQDGPIEPPGNQAQSAYRAEVMGCGSCEPDAVFAVYMRRGGELRGLDGGPWVSFDADPERARRIRDAARSYAQQRCEGDGSPRTCYPG